MLGTQETSCILIAGLLERDTFDLFLLEFDKPWVIHLRETCCCSTNLYTWRPNTVYNNRSVRRYQGAAHLLSPWMGSSPPIMAAVEELHGRPRRPWLFRPDALHWPLHPTSSARHGAGAGFGFLFSDSIGMRAWWEVKILVGGGCVDKVGCV
jgi:hypothetical protein